MLTLALAASALAGFCAKVVDEIADLGLDIRRKKKYVPFYFLPILLAIIYGAALAWLSSQTLLSSLFIAMAIASLLAGKIDHPYHVLGVGVFALLVWLMPPTVLDPWLFCLFLVSGLLDELELGGMAHGLFAFLNRERLWTPLAALGAFIVLGVPLLYLLALVVFDAAYRFGGWLVDYEFGMRNTTGSRQKMVKIKGKQGV